MKGTVFYAWQSDAKRLVTRDVIEEAAKAACERITSDKASDWSLTLDSDTRGVAGMCDIPNTILDKIRRSEIFLADLTLVGKSNDGSKQMPNSNVVFELGFAAGVHDFGALVGVMNEAYGQIDGQIFDIKRRGCLFFDLSENADKNARVAVKEKLSRDLEGVFRLTLDSIATKRREAEKVKVAPPADPAEIKEVLYRIGLHGRKLMHSSSPHQHEWISPLPATVERALRFEQASLFKSDTGIRIRECSEWLIDRVRGIRSEQIDTTFQPQRELTNYRLEWLNLFTKAGNDLRARTLGRTMHSEDISKPMNDWIAQVSEFLDVLLPDFAQSFLNDGGIQVQTYSGSRETSQLTQKMDRRLYRLNEILHKITSNPQARFR
jgi:hypothetical protein